jgi:hypothetical protein
VIAIGSGREVRLYKKRGGSEGLGICIDRARLLSKGVCFLTPEVGRRACLYEVVKSKKSTVQRLNNVPIPRLTVTADELRKTHWGKCPRHTETGSPVVIIEYTQNDVFSVAS